jgi:hypothetical protein
MDHTRKNAPRFLGETASQHIVRLERANHHGTREGMRERERERDRECVREREMEMEMEMEMEERGRESEREGGGGGDWKERD